VLPHVYFRPLDTGREFICLYENFSVLIVVSLLTTAARRVGSGSGKLRYFFSLPPSHPWCQWWGILAPRDPGHCLKSISDVNHNKRMFVISILKFLGNPSLNFFRFVSDWGWNHGQDLICSRPQGESCLSCYRWVSLIGVADPYYFDPDPIFHFDTIRIRILRY
jgi:hypothetical protein